MQVLFDLSTSPLQKGLSLLLLVLSGEHVNLKKEVKIFYLRRVRVWMEEDWVPDSLRELVCMRVCEAIQECQAEHRARKEKPASGTGFLENEAKKAGAPGSSAGNVQDL